MKILIPNLASIKLCFKLQNFDFLVLTQIMHSCHRVSLLFTFLCLLSILFSSNSMSSFFTFILKQTIPPHRSQISMALVGHNWSCTVIILKLQTSRDWTSRDCNITAKNKFAIPEAGRISEKIYLFTFKMGRPEPHNFDFSSSYHTQIETQDGRSITGGFTKYFWVRTGV